jgi:hypothetical protein
MLLSNIFFFTGIFRGSIVFQSAPSGRLALRYVLKEEHHMRNIFLAGAKLLGILGLYWAILIIPQIGFFLGIQTPMSEDNYSGAWIFSAILLYFLFAFGFGLTLIFRTEKIAEILKIKETKELVFNQKTDEMLRIGIILVGIFLLASAIPELAKIIFRMVQTSITLSSYNTSELISSILQICLGGWLSFSSRKVIHFITKRESS